MAAACSDLHGDKDSSSYLKMNELLRLFVIRKDSSAALRRQDAISLFKWPMKPMNVSTNGLDSVKSPVRVKNIRLATMEFEGVASVDSSRAIF